MYLFRLSRIGAALPVSHLYPTGFGAHERRDGAQCFVDIAEVVVELKMGSMVPGADRLLIISVGDDCPPTDESGWAIVDPAAVIGVRQMPLPSDPNALLAFDTDDEMWGAAEPVSVAWLETV